MTPIFDNQRPIARAGLSLVELIVVMLILSILAAAGSSRYADALARHRVQRSAERIAADIETARHVSRSRSQAVRLTFDTLNHRYTLTGIESPDHPRGTFTVSLLDTALSSRLSAASFGGDGVLEFNESGMPDSGGSLTLISGDRSQTVTVVADTGAVTVP